MPADQLPILILIVGALGFVFLLLGIAGDKYDEREDARERNRRR